jgi:hypothetical protein
LKSAVWSLLCTHPIQLTWWYMNPGHVDWSSTCSVMSHRIVSETAGSSDELPFRHPVLSSEGYRDMMLKRIQRGQFEIACMVVGRHIVNIRSTNYRVCRTRSFCLKKPRDSSYGTTYRPLRSSPSPACTNCARGYSVREIH